MKNKSSILSNCSIWILFLLGCVLGCDKLVIQEKDGDKTCRSLSLITKVSGDDVDAYLVKEEDINNYITFKKLEKCPKFGNTELMNIIPITWNDVTCLYVLEYEKGYEILSADKRSQVPLVVDSEGQFVFPSEESPFGFQIYTLAEDVWFSLYHNDLLDTPDDETKDNMASSMKFWALVNADFNTIQEQTLPTKARNDTIILNPEEGHWDLVDITYLDAPYDTVGHLVPTWWTQIAPFNNYCPYDTTTSTSRCPAGCVAIAAAQVLYYLHYNLGVPEESPSSGYCSGFVYNNTVVQSFGSFSEDTWDYMMPSADPSGYAAMLIGDVGKKVNMHYGANGSGAKTVDLKNNVFQPYGIQCSNYNNYSGTILRINLENERPVICAGHREITDSMGQTSYVGHAFIVDKFIRYRYSIVFTYEWVYDDPELDPGYTIIRTTTTYETPRIVLYQMNWGYGYEYNYNDVWCSMNGVWQYGARTPYTHNRRMVVGFSIINE